MRLFQKGRRRTLGFETLETRRALAGDVVAYIHLGELQVAGDAAPNAIELRGTGVAGEVLITPLVDQATGQQTTVNGSASPVVITGVTGGLSAGMRAGNDEIYIKDIVFNGDVWVRGMQGADIIRIGEWVAYGTAGTGDVTINGKLIIDEQHDSSATDKDTIFLGRVTVNTRIEINAYLGDDFIEFYQVTVKGQNMDNHPFALLVRGHDGHDVYNFAYTTVYGNTKLMTDGLATGHDLVSIITSVFHGSMYIDVWHGINTVALNANQFLSTLEIWSEIGDDTIRLTNSFINKKITIASFHSSQNGNDTITVRGNTISERLYIHAGSGNDTVVVEANQIVTAGIWMASGSDALIVRSNIFYGHIDVLGGTEYDVLYWSGNIFYSTYAIYEFESIQA